MKMNPFNGLEKLFHEPKRLAIMSSLCAAGPGISFAELKEACDMTDGNLNRHLKTLEAAEAVKIVKTTEKRPITRVFLTDHGRDGFHIYLQSLESVLARAAEALRNEELAHNNVMTDHVTGLAASR